jgi:fatty acid desaturase
MKRNEASWDRVIRVVLAALFAYLYFAGIVTGGLGLLLLVVGIVFLVTAIVGYCPLYGLLKFGTFKS